MDEQSEKFRWVHAVLKGSFRNLLNVTYGIIPKKHLVDSKDKIINSPELYNLWEAYDLALADFRKYNQPKFGGMNQEMLEKGRDIIFTLSSADSAYQAIMEFWLEEYFVLKLKDVMDEKEARNIFKLQSGKTMNMLLDKR